MEPREDQHQRKAEREGDDRLLDQRLGPAEPIPEQIQDLDARPRTGGIGDAPLNRSGSFEVVENSAHRMGSVAQAVPKVTEQ